MKKDNTKIKKPSVKTKNKPYYKTSKEKRAQIARENGAKTADLPRDGYKKAETLPEVEPTKYDLYADIYNAKAKYPPETKIAAATAYFLTGTYAGAARMTGLSKECVWDWKNNSQWWPIVYDKIKKEKQDELDANLTTLIHSLTSELAERLIEGDEILSKDGIIHKKMSGRDLANALNTLYDKRTMLRGDPTSISARANPTDVLNTLRDEFAKMAKDVVRKEFDKTTVN